MYINVEFCFSYIVYHTCNKLVIRTESMVHTAEINYQKSIIIKIYRYSIIQLNAISKYMYN